MRRFVLMVGLLLSGAALAQPIEIRPAGQISLSKGQVKILQFEEAISKVSIVLSGVIDAEPLTERQLAISGTGTGGTMLVVFAPDGRQIYNAAVIVSPEAGHIVKIYGQRDKNDDLNAGYSSTYCNEFGCGRPDFDLPKPTSVTVERIKRFDAR